MTRTLYGGSGGDLIAAVGSDGDYRPAGDALTAWDADTDGNQLTDLQSVSQTAITTVTMPTSGPPKFYGPDAYTESIWLQDSVGNRWRIDPADLASRAGGSTNADWPNVTNKPAPFGDLTKDSTPADVREAVGALASDPADAAGFTRDSGDGDLVAVTDAGVTVYGIARADGTQIANDAPVTRTLRWKTGDPDPTAGGTVDPPAGTFWIVTLAAGDELPYWLAGQEALIVTGTVQTPAATQLLTSFKGAQATSGNQLVSDPTTALIPAGATIVLATNRATATGNVNGVSGIAVADGAGNPVATGAWTLRDAGACRASTHDLAIHHVKTAVDVPAGSKFTVTFNSTAGSRKTMVGAAFSGLIGTRDATSGTTGGGGDGGTSIGPNGSGATASVSSSGSTAQNNEVVVAAFSSDATKTITPGPGFTLIDEDHTTAGSGDRGVMLCYQLTGTQDTKQATATYSASGGWAAALATYQQSA